jgi:glycine cleavage system regulatory protein
MANVKERILKELLIQEEIEGNSDNIDLIRKVLPVLKTQMDLNVLFKTKFHRYGKFSYEVHRFYYPSELLINLLNINK